MAQKNVKFVGSSSTLPIGTVVYLTEQELLERISSLRERYDFRYAYVKHKGESGKKDHIHVLMISNSVSGFRNVNQLREGLYSICDVDTEQYHIGDKVPSKPFVECKNLKCWALYHIHNVEYLTSIGEQREVEYSAHDLRGTPSLVNDLVEFIETSQHTSENDLDIIYNGIRAGLSDYQILSQFDNVTNDNLYSILNGIQKLRKSVTVDLPEWSSQFQIIAPYVFARLTELNPSLLHNVELVYKNTKKAQWEIAKNLIDFMLENAVGVDVLHMILESK